MGRKHSRNTLSGTDQAAEEPSFGRVSMNKGRTNFPNQPAQGCQSDKILPRQQRSNQRRYDLHLRAKLTRRLRQEPLFTCAEVQVRLETVASQQVEHVNLCAAMLRPGNQVENTHRPMSNRAKARNAASEECR